jgi:myo-inositol-1(or 4)-monophosphatase
LILNSLKKYFMNLEKVCEQVREIAIDTGNFIWEKRQGKKDYSVEVKGKHNYVTQVDKAAEKLLVSKLSEIIPEAGFIAEEGTSVKVGERYNWIIDPLDGTTNFMHALPPFAVSIALQDNKKLVLGVIYEMGLKECFYAWTGSKAFMNGSVIKVTNIDKVNDSLIATGFPYTNYGLLNEFMSSLSYFMENSHGLRRLGSAATDIAYTACGRFEGFYEYGLSPWDVAAGVVILRQAGGKVSDFSGGENFLHGKEIIASNSGIFNEFQETVSRLMEKK